MRNTNIQMLSGADTGNVTGTAVDSNQLVSASFVAVVADATAAGTVKLQFSNDICSFGNLAADFTPTNWVDIPSATITVAGATALAAGLSKIDLAYRWIRAVYTRSSGGSTTIVVLMNALGI